MLQTQNNRLAQAPRRLPATEFQADALFDKGPKHVGFDAPFLGGGRRATERALKLDRKR
jgi:hypothetical protein